MRQISPSDKKPAISVVIPMRNERQSIETCLNALFANELPRNQFEIIVVDGKSDDGSRELAQALLASSGMGRVVPNPKKITPSALNIGIEAARGDIIVILGAHSAVSPDFLEQNLAVLQESGADCVGGTLIPAKAESLLAAVIDVAQNCPFGSGGAGFRYSDKPGYANTVPFGAYRREVFDKVGRFDESLHKGQDAEFNFRMIRSGLRIYYSPRIRTRYFPRSSLGALFSQYLAMGWSKVFIFYRHPRMLRPYYFMPLLFAIASLVAVMRLFWASRAEMLFYLAAAASYAVFSVFGLAFARRRKIRLRNRAAAAVLFPIVFWLIHFSYGLGIIKGLVQLAFRFGKRIKRGQE